MYPVHHILMFSYSSLSLFPPSLLSIHTRGDEDGYVVTCLILQKNDVGLHTSTSCYWDSGADGCAIYRYDNDTLHAIVTVYGLSV